MKTRQEYVELLEKLIAYAVDRSGFPDGDIAKEKIINILNKFPELINHPDMVEFAGKELFGYPVGFADVKVPVEEPMFDPTLEDLFNFRQQGGDIAGSWTGTDYNEAIARMMNDYRDRMQRLNREFTDELFTSAEKNIFETFGIGGTSGD